jgi:hypothetical protein
MLANDSVSKSGAITFTARGYSMYPAICDLEKVTLVKVSFENLCVGDIVLCYTLDGPLLHRIIEKCDDEDEPFVVIKGDALLSGRHRVEPEDIAGRVARIHKRHKKRIRGLLMGKLFKKVR